MKIEAKQELLLMYPENDKDVFDLGYYTGKFRNYTQDWESSTDNLSPKLMFVAISQTSLFDYIENSSRHDKDRIK